MKPALAFVALLALALCGCSAPREHAELGLEVLSAGRLGPLRQRPSRSGKKQFVMFTNAGRALEPGASAVVVLGQARVERVPVS